MLYVGFSHSFGSLLEGALFRLDRLNIDAYYATTLKAGSYAYPGMRPTRFMGSQIVMPLGHTIEHERSMFL